MKKYYLSDKPGSYWCSSKGTFTDDIGNKRSRIGFWSSFESSKEDRIKYNIISGTIQLLICKLLGTNLNPKLDVIQNNEVKKE